MAMTEPTREEAIQLLRNGLARALMETAARYVMPICWIAARDRQPVILGSGSAFILDCGAGPFLVTANHVYEGYRASLVEHPDAVCLLGDLRFDLGERARHSDPNYDVATFDIDSEEISKLATYANGKMVLTGSQTAWPPQPPQVDKGVFFVGFPGDARTMQPYRGNSIVEVDWLGYTALAVARGVSDTDITLVFDHERDFDIGLRPSAPAGLALGGCSGAPLLSFVEQNGIVSWRLGGVIYEANELLLKAARADCLNPDGSLNPFPNFMVRRTR